MTITRLAHTVILAAGWRRAMIAFLAGAASALAIAPINAWPILFVTFPVLIWLVDGSAAGRLSGPLNAALAGWCFGFGYFLAGLYWIGYAFLVDVKTFGWLLPIAVAGLPAYLALYTALGLGVARLIWVRGPERLLAFAAAMTAAEWLRGHLLSGFPWNTFGYALTQPLVLAQSVSLVGIWALTFLCLAICATPAVLNDDKVDTRHPRRPLLIGIVILLALVGYGAVRLWSHPTEFVNNVRLRIMQPNLPQDDKFNYSAKAQVMDRYLRLSDRATGPQSNGARDFTHLIWPEAAFPFFLTREPDALAQIAALLKPSTKLIVGAVRAPDNANARNPQAYNSIYVIDADGSIRGIYDKVHLVPFGEYLPFQRSARADRADATHQGRWRISFRRSPPRDGCRRCAENAAADLLRSHLPRRGSAARRTTGLARQRNERWLVRHQFRTVPTFPASAHPRHRRRPAAGARG